MQNKGFSLIWVSVLVTVVGILLTATLPTGRNSGLEKSAEALSRVQRIEEAMRGFMAANGRRPCPADATLSQTSRDFGREAQTPGVCAGGAPEANFLDDPSTPTVVAGAVPVRTLSLSDEYAVDAYGHRLIYVVDLAATDAATCRQMKATKTNGAVRILSRFDALAADDYVMWAIVSYGADAHGAFPENGGGFARRLNTGNANPDTLLNAFVTPSFAIRFTGSLVRHEPVYDKSNGFDDLVWFQSATKNVCCVGPLCNSGL